MDKTSHKKPHENESDQKCNCCECFRRIRRNFLIAVTWPIGDIQRLIAVGTFMLAIATCLLAAFAFQQVQVMKTDQRPWVGLGDILPLTAPNNPHGPAVAMRLILKNGGKSPAMNANIFITGGAGEDCSKYSIPHQPCEGDNCTFRSIELLSDNTLGAQVPRNEQEPLPPGSSVCLIARVDYEDADGGKHKTGICLIHGLVSTRTCAEKDSNYAD